MALLGRTAADIARLVEALFVKGAPGVALVGGLSKPILPWLPDQIRPMLVAARHDPLHGAIMLARSELVEP